MSQRHNVNGRSVPNRLYYPMRLHGDLSKELTIPNPINRKTMYQWTTGIISFACFFYLGILSPEMWKIIVAGVPGVVMLIANAGPKIIDIYGKWMDRRHQNRMNKLIEKEQQYKTDRIERNGYDIEDHLGA